MVDREFSELHTSRHGRIDENLPCAELVRTIFIAEDEFNEQAHRCQIRWDEESVDLHIYTLLFSLGPMTRLVGWSGVIPHATRNNRFWGRRVSPLGKSGATSGD